MCSSVRRKSSHQQARLAACSYGTRASPFSLPQAVQWDFRSVNNVFIAPVDTPRTTSPSPPSPTHEPSASVAVSTASPTSLQKKAFAGTVEPSPNTRYQHPVVRSVRTCSISGYSLKICVYHCLLEVGAPLVVCHFIVALLLDLWVLLKDVRHGSLRGITKAKAERPNERRRNKRRVEVWVCRRWVPYGASASRG